MRTKIQKEHKITDISRESYLQTVMRRFRKHHLAAVSLVILVILGSAALLAPVIAPYDPDAIVGSFSGAPNAQFWLGTDQIGRDVLSRLLYAMRISLLVGVMATLISTVIGVVLGLIAGYFGGVADMIIMRFTDMVMSFPTSFWCWWRHPFQARPVEYHPDPGLCGLARHSPAGQRECAQPTGNQFYQRKHCGRNALRHIPIFGDSAQYGGAYPGLRHLCPGASMLDEAAFKLPGLGVQPLRRALKHA